MNVEVFVVTPEITVIYAAENTQRFTLLSIVDFGYNWPEIHTGSFWLGWVVVH